MSTFAFFLLVIQACLFQNAFGCGCGTGLASTTLGYGVGNLGFGGYGLSGISGYGLGGLNGYSLGGYGLAAPAYGAAYGGVGEGTVACAGELPVAGNTVVIGQVPVLGAVQFSGNLPAAGSVAISGSCGCGCNSGYLY